MDDQLRNFLSTLAAEKIAGPEPAKPQSPQDIVDEEVRQALAICHGDAIAALRTTLIANAFLEAQVEELQSQISASYDRRKNRVKAK
jgi:hypothetical protein